MTYEPIETSRMEYPFPFVKNKGKVVEEIIEDVGRGLESVSTPIVRSDDSVYIDYTLLDGSREVASFRCAYFGGICGKLQVTTTRKSNESLPEIHRAMNDATTNYKSLSLFVDKIMDTVKRSTG
ncbi:MAG: hypothetical protein ABIH37_03760 [archaeon]